jgi:hypothetical protein
MKKENNLEEVDTSNIFDEFTKDSELKDEIEKTEKKNIYFYLKKISFFLKIFLIISLLSLILMYSYVWVQENEDIKNESIMDPLCYIFI